jgi:hypothetical protein
LKTYNSNQVFIPGGKPILTYNPRKKYGLEEKLLSLKTYSSKFISVTGSTKSGKTVLINKIFPEEKCIWYAGGSFSNEESFWSEICNHLRTYTEVSIETGLSKSIGIEAEANLSNPILRWFASLSAKLTGNFSRQKSSIKSLSISSKSAALDSLRKNKIPVVIDDFHYINKLDQKNIL